MFNIKYHLKVEDEVLALPKETQVKFIRLVDKLKDNPNLLREPHTKFLSNGLFELRTMGNNIARGIWAYKSKNTIIILRVFVKKTNKIPKNELEIALARLQELQEA